MCPQPDQLWWPCAAGMQGYSESCRPSANIFLCKHISFMIIKRKSLSPQNQWRDWKCRCKPTIFLILRTVGLCNNIIQVHPPAKQALIIKMNLYFAVTLLCFFAGVAYTQNICGTVQAGQWVRDPQDCTVAHQCGFEGEIAQSTHCNTSQVWSNLAHACVWEGDPDRDDCNGNPHVPIAGNVFLFLFYSSAILKYYLQVDICWDLITVCYPGKVY